MKIKINPKYEEMRSFIERIPDVTVEYKGDRYAAVKGLSVNQNIILSSSKQISDSGRIKPQKQ